MVRTSAGKMDFLEKAQDNWHCIGVASCRHAEDSERRRVVVIPLTPLEFGRRAFRHYASRLAVIDGRYRATYGEMAARVYRYASQLRREGIGRGDRVAVLAPNTHEMLESFYAIPWIGAVMVPLSTRLESEEYRYIVQHADARLLVVDADLLPRIAAVLPWFKRVLVIGTVPEGMESFDDWLSKGDASPFAYDVADETQMITLNYTSGTTARPKGVMLTHRNTCLNATNFIVHLGVTLGEPYLHALPMFHVNGWGGVWGVSGMGGVHVCARRVDGPSLWDAIYEHQVRAMCGAPIVLNTMTHTPHHVPSSPLRIFTGGAPPPAALVERFMAEGITVVHVYGLTETGPWATISERGPEQQQWSKEDVTRQMSYQGIEQLLTGEVKVVRDDGTEVRWDGHEPGEIVVRGNTVMEGYYQQPDETARVIRSGWFYTGDLAVVHPTGYIQITDRAKDVIISGGENISSIEVEDVLYRHPAILEAAVVAVPHDKWGETPKAIVVLKPDHTVSAEDLIEFCRQHLAHFKCPTSVDFVGNLPRTASGKVAKFQLREQYWQGKSRRVQG